ncbi:hypothetical protein Acor_69170 [Acrocarpospora corrugata]|uniref:Uncharacterized protein n=1 Tax=Acrocarpospora corrugata TaxID=35763 RepID=A0A5M3W929_9ACTN|nr:hypothetical protein [Acrocarpospora corrugata]GES04849.1 hypothetical protein Acor_69170 [Acrocarpospora corrugata]
MLSRDSVGMPYEITLALRRNGAPYGVVGERCGWFLARLARGVAAARGEAGDWRDPDDRFPGPGEELFTFRYRARTDIVGSGELRCQVRTIPSWQPGAGREPGKWRLTRRAFVEAWGSSGVGLRAVLTSGQLAAFLNGLVAEAEDRLGTCFGMERNSNLIKGAGTVARPR